MRDIRKQDKPFTAEQNNLNGLLMCKIINKYKAYDNQVLSKFSSERVADEGEDCCESEEDEINFYHEEADEEADEDKAIFPTRASPRIIKRAPGGAPSPKAPGRVPPKAPGGTPSPKHYRQKIKFTDDVDESPSGDPKDHQCEPGMTELGGWIICKHCGTNLRKI